MEGGRRPPTTDTTQRVTGPSGPPQTGKRESRETDRASPGSQERHPSCPPPVRSNLSRGMVGFGQCGRERGRERGEASRDSHDFPNRVLECVSY